jgi:hypothetical protein
VALNVAASDAIETGLKKMWPTTRAPETATIETYV